MARHHRGQLIRVAGRIGAGASDRTIAGGEQHPLGAGQIGQRREADRQRQPEESPLAQEADRRPEPEGPPEQERALGQHVDHDVADDRVHHRQHAGQPGRLRPEEFEGQQVRGDDQQHGGCEAEPDGGVLPEAGPGPPISRCAAAIPSGWSGWSTPCETPSLNDSLLDPLRPVDVAEPVGEGRLGVIELPAEQGRGGCHQQADAAGVLHRGHAGPSFRGPSVPSCAVPGGLARPCRRAVGRPGEPRAPGNSANCAIESASDQDLAARTDSPRLHPRATSPITAHARASSGRPRIGATNVPGSPPPAGRSRPACGTASAVSACGNRAAYCAG